VNGSSNGGWNVSYVTYVQSAASNPAQCGPGGVACPFTLVVESFFAGGVWHSSHGCVCAGVFWAAWAVTASTLGCEAPFVHPARSPVMLCVSGRVCLCVYCTGWGPVRRSAPRWPPSSWRTGWPAGPSA
jgi:hypothetical protein